MVRRLVASLVFLVLAACGGGGGSSGGSSGGGGASAPKPTSVEAARFLTQATFGPTDASVAEVTNLGYDAWIDRQIRLPYTPSHLSYLDTRLAELRAANANASLSSNQFYESWWKSSVQSEDQLRKRVAFALSQIFVVSLADAQVTVRGAGSWMDMLERNALGSFRTLLEDVTLHPMMGGYLTYRGNQKEDPARGRSPDENYAREVMQLMTIGLYELNSDGSQKATTGGAAIPSYTPADIAGLAKVFTGISWYHPTPTNTTFSGGNADPQREVTPMIFYANYHSTSEKTFLGVTIPASTTVDIPGDLKIALDTLSNHPNVGPFISERLIQQLVTSNPSRAYVSRVAAVFNNNGSGVRGDLGAVVKAILTDSEARAAAGLTDPGFGKLKEPLLRLTQLFRAFQATSQTNTWLVTSTSSNSGSLAQSPLTSPSVFNFWRPGFVPPATTEIGSRSLKAPEFQIVDEVSVAGYVNFIQSAIDKGVGSNPTGSSTRDVQFNWTAELALADQPAALADRLNGVLFAGRMSSTLRQRIIDGVTAITIPSGGTTTQAQIDAAKLNRVKTAVVFSAVSPEFLVQR